MKENVFSKILIVVYILLGILIPFAFIKFCLNDQSRYLWFWLLLIIYLFVSIIFNRKYFDQASIFSNQNKIITIILILIGAIVLIGSNILVLIK